MAKSFLSILLVYSMKALWLPESIYNYVDKSIRNCIWSKNGHSRSWNFVRFKDITYPKTMGGLGIRSTRLNNITMLGKLVDDLLHDKGQLWVRSLVDKYLSNDHILISNFKSGDSYIWRGII